MLSPRHTGSERRPQAAAGVPRALSMGTLPRDTRDTLFLLAVIAWVLAPLVPALPAWASVMAAGVLAWRARMAWTGGALPGARWRLGLLALAVAGTLWSHHTLVGREAGVTLLVTLMALKTLELRARRDGFVVFFLGLFLLLTQLFASQSLLTALSVVTGALGLQAALANAHQPVGRPTLARSGALALRLTLRGLPIVVLLFLLFPRLPPLWGLPADGLGGRTGLSARMSVGDLARLALDDAPALRVRFEGGPPARADLYFRGPVLGGFDGRAWLPLYPDLGTLPIPEVVDRRAPVEPEGPALNYQVALEPSRHPWLPVLDIARSAPVFDGGGPAARAVRTPESQWLLPRPVVDTLRYRAQSHPRARQGPVDRIGRIPLEYRELPPGFNPRTLQLATDLMRASRAPAEDKAALVEAALDLLRRGGFRYTLEPGTAGVHTADTFWFDQREGFCEHFASAFAVLMRGMDIPARVVTGYLGGEPEPGTGLWLVRQSDAHAWVEVWLQGRGWVRVDPTAAVAPDRLGQLQRLSAPPGLVAGAVTALGPGLAERLRGAWTALEGLWRDRVVQYTQSRQLDLIGRLGWSRPSPQDLVIALGALLAAGAVLGLGVAALSARRAGHAARHPADPLRRLFARTRRRLARGGLVVEPGCTPRQMAQAALARFGAKAEPLAQWLMALEAARYGAQAPGAPGTRRLARQWTQLAWPC